MLKNSIILKNLFLDFMLKYEVEFPVYFDLVILEKNL